MKQTYIAFLRGINVGGHTVKMERLRELFTELDFEHVRSYINSGNIFFDTLETDGQMLTNRIEQHLQQTLGFPVPTFLRTVAEVEAILSQNPFGDIALTSDTRFCVVFTKQLLDTTLVLPQYSSKQDMDLVAIQPHAAFVVWHIIKGRPPSGTFTANILPKENTTRFYHTLAKILKAAKGE